MDSTEAPEQGRPSKDKQRAPGARSGRGPAGLLGRVGLFYRQIIAELRKVVWPTRDELMSFTVVVIVFVAVVMAFVYGIDTLFAHLSLWIFG